jgi:hypothetical protein
MKITIAAFLLLLSFSAVLFLKSSSNSEVQARPIVKASDDPIDWEKMDHSDRMAYMKSTVLPAMRKEFAAFDPKKYEKIKCTTCHGAGAEDGSYKMPNPDIMKLPNSKEGWGKIMAEKADMLKFMKEVVKPKMAALLGMKPYDMKTQTGFGCGNCHTDEK